MKRTFSQIDKSPKTAVKKYRNWKTASTLVKSFTKAKLYRGPTPYDQTYNFERSCAFVTNINENTGFIGPGGNSGQWLGIDFELRGATAYINGTLDYTSLIPNVTEFQALFDQYKIERVDITPIFSNNTSNTNLPSTVLPVIYQAFDFDSVTGTNSLFEYPQCKTLQLGAINNGTTRFTLWKPTVELVSGTTGSGATIDISKISPWCDTTTTDISHHGIRFQFQNFGRNSNTDIGTILWQIKIYYKFKYAR